MLSGFDADNGQSSRLERPETLFTSGTMTSAILSARRRRIFDTVRIFRTGTRIIIAYRRRVEKQVACAATGTGEGGKVEEA